MITKFEDTFLDKFRIEGVMFKNLKTFPDNRGFFREIVRSSDDFFSVKDVNSSFGQGSFGQWSHSKMAKNTVKAWHFHHLQTDWWYIGLGLIHTVLIDNRLESPSYKRKIEFLLGESELSENVLCASVKIPPGVLHGCKVLSENAHLFYITSKIYDPQDEGRIPFDSKEIDYNWGNPSELIVSERDTKPHTPPYKLD